MLVPGADSHPPNDCTQAARPAIHCGIDALALLTALEAMVSEAMPQQRALTPSQKSLLRALSMHLEATTRPENSRVNRRSDGAPARVALEKTAAVTLLLAQLTPAERHIVELVRQGWSNKEIAYMLDKSVRTVKTQLTSVYKKFAVRSRSRLLAKLS